MSFWGCALNLNAPDRISSGTTGERLMNNKIESAAPPLPAGYLVVEVPVAGLDLRYERLRLVRPREYALVRDSIRRYGQIHPVCGGEVPQGSYALIDGFKRYRACVELAVPTMRVRVIGDNLHAHKAAIINFNSDHGRLHAFEEALVATSLYRDDHLNQQQIATLFGRHKSWACRRIALGECLCEEAVEELRLGLLGFATAREIGRLPRGNQREALSCIHKHRLSSRESARLVNRLLQSPRWEHENYMHLPLDILDDRSAPRPRRRLLCAAVQEVFEDMIGALRKSDAAADAATGRQAAFDAIQRITMLEAVENTLLRLSCLTSALKSAADTPTGLGNRAC